MKKYSNDELDKAFTKINMYYLASSNKLVQDIMYKNMQELAIEAGRRDKSLKHKIQQYLTVLKGYTSNESRESTTDDN